MVTIQDVARAAGVSPMTVSNVLNEHNHVRPATRAKVLKSIDSLGYRVNIAARNLRAGRTGTIGFAVPDFDRAYSAEQAARIVHAAQRRGLRVVVEETGTRRQDELDAVALSRVRLYDGLILSAVGLAAADLEQFSAGGPVVLLGEQASVSPIDHVGVPNVAGTRAVVAHLLAIGCRRIALLGALAADGTEASRLRIRGYREELTTAGHEVDPDLILECAEWSMSSGWEATTDLIRRGTPFDAIFGLTDSLANGALRALADAGIAVPGAVAVAGFDNIAESRFVVPSLTTLAPEHDQIAEMALAFLVERIEHGEDAGPGRDVTSDFHLAIRESTGARDRADARIDATCGAAAPSLPDGRHRHRS
ncbi:MAG: LacI family transcriptional regulator [Micrococcales bacterium]|nr:LacI family transcriptional regulator [Micrococcales bacterium]